MIRKANIKDSGKILPMFLDLVNYNSLKSGKLNSRYSSKNWMIFRENELNKALLDENGYFLIAKIDNNIGSRLGNL